MFDHSTSQFLGNLYRQNVPPAEPQPGVELINLALAEAPLGDPLMSDSDLAVFVAAFETTGFTPSINWHRSTDCNWHLLADVDPVIRQPTLMIYGDRDAIPRSPNLTSFVPNAEQISLDCGHWIQQEKPHQTNHAILTWLQAAPASQ